MPHLDAVRVGREQRAIRGADVLVVGLALQEPAVERQRAGPVAERQLRGGELGGHPGVVRGLVQQALQPPRGGAPLALQEIDARANAAQPRRRRILGEQLVQHGRGLRETLRAQQNLHVVLAQRALRRPLGEEPLHRGERFFRPAEACEHARADRLDAHALVRVEGRGRRGRALGGDGRSHEQRQERDRGDRPADGHRAEERGGSTRSARSYCSRARPSSPDVVYSSPRRKWTS